MKALHNKIAIVTGAAAGFGEGIARLFVAEGARVLLADLDLERARAVAASLGPAAYAVRCDVSRAQDVEAAVQACVQQFGIPQVVVNNAGTTHRNQPMLEVDEATFDRVFNVNVKSIYHMARAVVPLLRKQGHGCIINIGSINIGSTQHLTAELFKSAAGLDAQVVPFNGTPAVMTALRGGQIDVALEVLSPVLPQIKGGALKALAVTGQKRSSALPQVPTAKEAGIPSLVSASWNGLGVPAKTPAAVVERLNKEVNAALQNPAVRQKLLDLNVEPHPSTVAQAHDWLQTEIKRWGDVIQRAGIQKQ